MRWILLLLLCSCAAPLALGIMATSSTAIGVSAMNRRAGDCYSTCTGGLVCNGNTGLCEQPREHCDISGSQPVCVPESLPGDVSATAQGGPTVHVAPPPPPLTGDAVRIIPAAEANPPSSR